MHTSKKVTTYSFIICLISSIFVIVFNLFIKDNNLKNILTNLFMGLMASSLVLFINYLIIYLNMKKENYLLLISEIGNLKFTVANVFKLNNILAIKNGLLNLNLYQNKIKIYLEELKSTKKNNIIIICNLYESLLSEYELLFNDNDINLKKFKEKLNELILHCKNHIDDKI